MSTIESRLADMGITIPEPTAPLAAYVGHVVHNGIVTVSGKVACGGDIERIERCIRLGGFVASTADFTDHPKVVNGASEFMGAILGEKGAHARAAVGVAALPLNASVEVEATFAIR